MHAFKELITLDLILLGPLSSLTAHQSNTGKTFIGI